MSPTPICSSAASAASSPTPWLAPIAATSSPRGRSALRARSRPRVSRVSSKSSARRSAGSKRSAPPRSRRRAPRGRKTSRREQVGSAALQHGRLLCEQVAPDPRRGRLAERPDGAGNEDVAARHLARLAGELDRRELIRSTRPRGTVMRACVCWRRRCSPRQLGAGVDEADVQRPTASGARSSPPRGSAGAARRRR